MLPDAVAAAALCAALVAGGIGGSLLSRMERRRAWPASAGETSPDRLETGIGTGTAGAAPPRMGAAPGAAGMVPEANRLLHSIVEHLSDPILVLDRSWRLRYANRQARLLLGDSTAAVLRHPGLREAAARLDDTEPAVVDLALDVPVRRRLRASLLPLEAPFAAQGLFTVVLSDRSHDEAMEQMRQDFVANASHELRTPLASLIGFIDTLLGPAADDPEAQRRFLGIMAEQAARMRRLIDNLLSLSRIQMVEHARPRGTVDLALLLSRAAEELAPQMARQGQTLRREIAPALPDIVGDADQIVQVVQNLLDNAVKYGGSGATIALSARRTQDGRREDAAWPSQPGVVIAVRDQGAGIAAHHIPRLTERFYRVEDGNAGKPGSGLGLAIVKHIVGRHRGRMLIESLPGEGACFSIWLPV